MWLYLLPKAYSIMSLCSHINCSIISTQVSSKLFKYSFCSYIAICFLGSENSSWLTNGLSYCVPLSGIIYFTIWFLSSESCQAIHQLRLLLILKENINRSVSVHADNVAVSVCCVCFTGYVGGMVEWGAFKTVIIKTRNTFKVFQVTIFMEGLTIFII